MSYEDIVTFDDWCYYSSLYVNDIVKSFPGWKDTPINNKSLYEMKGKYDWISKIIYGYNLLGFATNISQPGIYEKCDMYKNHYDYITQDENDEIELLDGNYNCGQRAFIRGFMLKTKTMEIYED